MADGAAAAGAATGDAPQSSQDLTVFVQSLLQQMQSRFGQMSEAIIGRIDEMGNRIDDLEKSIGELMQQADVAGLASARARTWKKLLVSFYAQTFLLSSEKNS